MSKKNTTTESARKNGTSSCARYRFSGHQTFVARNGWLEKGVNLILNNPHGFLDSDAVVQLGVGKNMVESIKYWCQQTGLIEDSDVAGTMRLTDLGRFLFGDGKKAGVDPYLEDDASLWLLHYRMVVDAPESTWSIVFNHYNKPEFRKDEMTPFIKRRLSDKGQSISNTAGTFRDGVASLRRYRRSLGEVRKGYCRVSRFHTRGTQVRQGIRCRPPCRAPARPCGT